MLCGEYAHGAFAFGMGTARCCTGTPPPSTCALATNRSSLAAHTAAVLGAPTVCADAAAVSCSTACNVATAPSSAADKDAGCRCSHASSSAAKRSPEPVK